MADGSPTAQVAIGGLGSNSDCASKQVILERPIRESPEVGGVTTPDHQEGARRNSRGELGCHSKRCDCTEHRSQNRQAIARRATVAE